MPITTKDAARALHVSERRVRQYIEDGRLKAEKFGNAWLVNPESLDSFIKVPRRSGRPKKNPSLDSAS